MNGARTTPEGLIPIDADVAMSEADRVAHNSRVLVSMPRADFIDDWIVKAEGAQPRGKACSQ